MINGWREWFQKRMERSNRQPEFVSIDARRYSNNNSRTYEMLQSPAKNVDDDGTVIRCPDRVVTSGSVSNDHNNNDHPTMTTRIFSVPITNTVDNDIVHEKRSETDDMNDDGDGSNPNGRYPSAGSEMEITTGTATITAITAITTTTQAAASTGNNTISDDNNNRATIYRSPTTNLSYSTPRPPPPLSSSSSSSLRSPPRTPSTRLGRGREWDPKDTHAPSMMDF